MSPEASPSPGSGGTDERRFNEKLDDIQAAHPLPYNLVVGLIVGLIALAFGFHWLVVPLYALSYGLVRAYLWGDGRILRRQYEVRKVRSDAARAERRRRT
ncbi:MAG TPA: hypothetical protein VIR58_14620 [Acidimicrobiales bacterium]